MNCPLNPKIRLLNPELFIPDKITPANQSEAVLSYVTYVRVAIQLAFFFFKLHKKTAKDIEDMVDNPIENKLTDNQIKVGKALVEVLTNWEELFARMGSDKFNKSSILLFLKQNLNLMQRTIRLKELI